MSVITDLLPATVCEMAGPRPLKGCGIALALEQAAERNPDTPVLLDSPLDLAPEQGCALDYGRLATIMLEASGALAAAGVTRGDRVAVVKRNNFDILVLAYALMRLGATVALVSAALDRSAHESLLARLKPDVVLTDSPAASHRPGSSRTRYLRVGSDSESAGEQHLQEFWGAPLRKPRPALDDELAMILHSSGTTGIPKLIMHSARSLKRIAYVGKYQAVARLAPLRGDDLVAASLAWIHGRAAVGYALAFTRNVGLLAISDPHPTTALPLLERHAPSIVETHPNIYLRWQRALNNGEPFRNVRMFLSTADAMAPATVSALLKASRRRMPLFVEVYGMTEMGPATARLTRRGSRRPRHSRLVGRPIPGFSRVRVVDTASGHRLRRGRVGMIQISTKASLIGYLGQDSHFAGDGRRRWFNSGDIGVKTRTGAIRLLDRQVDRLDGVSSCVEVEEKLLARFPDALEIVVVRGPAGEALPVVATVDDAPLDSAAWQLATRNMPRLGQPVQIPFDQFPLTATWKVRRFVLQDRLAPRPARA